MISVDLSNVESIESSNHLYQWDKGQQLEIKGLGVSKAPEIHFGVNGSMLAIVVNSTLSGGIVYADIPNEILMSGKDLRVYVHIDGTTIKNILIPVFKRNMPENYVVDNGNVTWIEEFETEANEITTEKCNEIEAKGASTLESIPDDYTVLQNEVTDLKSDLSEINGRFVYGKNLYNPETAVDGKWINNITQSPPQIESLSYLCYNFVKITGAGDYYFKWPVGSVGENFYKTSIYDETKAHLFERNAIKISGEGNNTIVKLTISQGDISEGAFYIGYNQSISYKNELMVVKGEYPSEYIPYVSGFDMPELNVKSDQIENYPVVTPDVINFFDKSKTSSF